MIHLYERQFPEESQLDLLNMLYPEIQQNVSDVLSVDYDYIDALYAKETMLPIINYVLFRKDQVGDDASKGKSEAVDFLIIQRAKELLCRYGAYERAFELGQEKTKAYLDKKIREQTILLKDMPIISNELIARIHCQKDIDDQMYNVLKLVSREHLEHIKFYHYDLGWQGKYYCASDEIEFVGALLPFLYKLVLEGEDDTLRDYTVQLCGELFMNFQLYYQPDEGFMAKALVSYHYLKEIYKIYVHRHTEDLTFQLLELYLYGVFVYLKGYEKMNHGNVIKIYTIKELMDGLSKFIGALRQKFVKRYSKELSYLLQILEEVVYDFEGEYDSFVQCLVGQLDKSSLPKYKRELIEGYLMDPKHIPALAALKKYDIIVRVYLEQKSYMDFSDYASELGVALVNRDYIGEGLNVLRRAVRDGMKSVAIYKQLGAIYENHYKDYERAQLYYLKALKLVPTNEGVVYAIENLKEKINR